MPIYEFQCAACGVREARLVRGFGAAAPACPRCGAASMERLISRVAILRSEKDIHLGPAQANGDADYYRDWRNVGRHTKQRLNELGVDLGPQVDEIIEKARDGSILKETGGL